MLASRRWQFFADDGFDLSERQNDLFLSIRVI